MEDTKTTKETSISGSSGKDLGFKFNRQYFLSKTSCTNILLFVIALILFFGFYLSFSDFREGVNSLGIKRRVDSFTKEIKCVTGNVSQDEYFNKQEELKKLIATEEANLRSKYGKVLMSAYLANLITQLNNLVPYKKKNIQVSCSRVTIYRFDFKISETESCPDALLLTSKCN